MVVWRLQTARNGRSDERERDSEILLRCEHEHGTPVQLKVVNRWIADELNFGCDWLDLQVDRTVRMV